MSFGESFLVVLGIFAFVGSIFGLFYWGVHLQVMEVRRVAGSLLIAAAFLELFIVLVFALHYLQHH